MRIVIEYTKDEALLTLGEVMTRTESAYLRAIVTQIGRRGAAANALGISRKTLWEKLRALGMSDLPELPPIVVQTAEALKISPSRMFAKLQSELLKPFTIEA